jgi:hypothetical protein
VLGVNIARFARASSREISYAARTRQVAEDESGSTLAEPAKAPPRRTCLPPISTVVAHPTGTGDAGIATGV